MSWSVPAVFTTGQVLTAAQMNAISGDLTDLDSRTNPQTAQVASTQTTTSTTLTNLATVGPVVTMTTGTVAVVMVTVFAANSTAGDGGNVGVAVSGATTIAAPAGGVTPQTNLVAAGTILTLSGCWLITGLNPGSNTFTLQYAASSGGTATFYSPRTLTVLPGNKLS